MNDQKMYSEVYAVLLNLSERLMSRIPEDVVETIKGQADEALMPIIDENKGLDEQGLSNDAMAFMAMLKLDYWCDSDEERQEFEDFLKANQQELDEVMQQAVSMREKLRLIRENK